ncbi:glycosyltransferase family 4 protein [Plantactinospora sp. WMMC1484]|uniref:glycosyltransferase family 4 protein n=1 Tax=Plantactinospora sp. WMMC1484 TaxID=3404122 RepID=UPI003BF4A450
MIDSILVFSRSTPQHVIGGMETLAWNLAVQLAGHVRQVRLVTTALPGTDGPFEAEGVEVVPLPGTAPGRYSAAWWAESRRYWEALPAPPDVVLSVSAGAYSVARTRHAATVSSAGRAAWARAARTRSGRSGTPFVLQAHGTSAMEFGSKLRAGNLRSLATSPKNLLALPRDFTRYRNFDRIVAVGERVVESLTGRPLRWSVPPERVSLIPNGVRPADFGFDPAARAEVRARLGIGDEVIAIGCVGRLHVQKRLDRAIGVAAALRDRGLGERFRFLLVGGGPDGPRLRRLAGRLGVRDMVTFVGPVDPTEVPRYHSGADVSLLTTARLEGLPMTVLESLACGLPCVVPAGAIGGTSLGPVLHQVDPDDPEAVAEALRAAVRTPGGRASLLPAELTLDHCARSYLALFEELRGRSGPP